MLMMQTLGEPPGRNGNSVLRDVVLVNGYLKAGRRTFQHCHYQLSMSQAVTLLYDSNVSNRQKGTK